jgi:hypothetical protein
MAARLQGWRLEIDFRTGPRLSFFHDDRAVFDSTFLSPKSALGARYLWVIERYTGRLQQLQRSTPSHFSKRALSLQGLGHADVAQSRRRGLISAANSNEAASNFQQRDKAHKFVSAKTPVFKKSD